MQPAFRKLGDNHQRTPGIGLVLPVLHGALARSGSGKAKRPAKQSCLVELLQRCHGRLGIGGKLARLVDVLAVEDVPAERLGQRLVTIGQCHVIGCGAAIKGLAKGLHALGHGEVADPHFAQIVVHIAAKMVEQGLRQGRSGRNGFQPSQHQPQMQQKQVKTAVNRIRHAQVPVKQGFSRLRHDHAIDGLDGAGRGDRGLPEVIERPEHCRFHERT